ncbi:telomeric repeat binding factor a [Puntigrus tetrazona]|uniref:telomeric repeat binding factor a n=1 Tax=Puntigrus tetrazona TaxID=1606681 RepID=UPI001C8A0231|nr:telomeric repeat binding factor a [Puntigrus tetrazona]
MSASATDAMFLSDEQVVNRWGFDYYVFKALGAFRDGDYTAFEHFTRVVESLVLRPVDGRGDMIVKLRFMQFLSRINNGDRLDLMFEEPQTPLESALSVLETICRDMSVPQRQQEQVRHAIVETLVVVCIRSGEFEKAEELLLRLFSDSNDSAGRRKLLMNLIRRRRSSHSVLQLSSFSDFKQDMLDFLEQLYRVPEPFLLQMLKRSGHRGQTSQSVTSPQDERTSSAAAEDHGGVCAARLSLRALQRVYGVLRERYAVSVSFTQLQRELEDESQEPEGPHAGMTISRLVQEDDSQLSEEEEEQTVCELCSDECVCFSQGRRRQKRMVLSSEEESEESSRHRQKKKKSDHRSVSSESDDLSSSPASQTHHRHSSPSGGTHSRKARWEEVSGMQENWSDEESLFGSSSGRSSRKCSRKMWTLQESEWLKEGVQRYGVGHWEKIRSSFPFSGRTAVNLKDRWRTMLKLRLV